MLDDARAERTAVAGDLHGFVETAAHLARRTHPVRQAGHVHLLHHLLEAVIGSAHQIGFGALEDDLARGQRFGPHLLFHAHDAVAVARPVAQITRHGKQGDTGVAGRRTDGARQRQRNVCVGVRGKPFVAVEPPDAILLARLGLQLPDIGAAGPLHHPLRAFPQRIEVGGGHPRQQFGLQFVAREFCQDLNRGVGNAERAHHAEFGLGEEILERVLDRQWRGSLPAERTGRVTHGVHLEVFEADLLHLAIGGVIFDLVDIAAEPIAVLELGWIALDLAGEFIEPPACDFAELANVRLEMAHHGRFHVGAQRGLKTRVDIVEIHALAVGCDGRGFAACRL